MLLRVPLLSLFRKVHVISVDSGTQYKKFFSIRCEADPTIPTNVQDLAGPAIFCFWVAQPGPLCLKQFYFVVHSNTVETFISESQDRLGLRVIGFEICSNRGSSVMVSEYLKVIGDML